MVRVVRKIKRIVVTSFYKTFHLKAGKKFTVLGRLSVDNFNVKIGNNVTLYDNVSFNGDGEIIIGDNVVIGNNTVIFSTERIEIKDNVLIAANNYIIDCDHGVRKEELIREQPIIKQPVTIGDDVWLGASVVVLKGVNIPKGCVIGANSTVTKELKENYQIYVGSPVRGIKTR